MRNAPLLQATHINIQDLSLYFKKKNAKKAATERSRDGLKIRFEIVKSLKKPIK